MLLLLKHFTFESYRICSLEQIRTFSWDKKQFTQPFAWASTPTRGEAPQATPGACQYPDAKLGKALAATSGCTARSIGSCANRSGIASGSGLTHALLGHIFLLLTFVLSNVWAFHLLHTRVIWKGLLSDQQGCLLYSTFYFPTNPCFNNGSLYKFMTLDFCLICFIMKHFVRSGYWLETCDMNFSFYFKQKNPPKPVFLKISLLKLKHVRNISIFWLHLYYCTC